MNMHDESFLLTPSFDTLSCHLQWDVRGSHVLSVEDENTKEIVCPLASFLSMKFSCGH